MTTANTTNKPFMIEKWRVYEAYKAVKSNHGAAGVDGQTIEQFEANCGPAYVTDEEAAKRPPNALADNLQSSLEKGPVKFRLVVQVAAADDSTADATKVWPDSRPTVKLGEIAVIKALDTKKVENELLFLAINVTSGIDPSDDPIINTRTEAYAESFGRRTK
jgi:catalase